MKGKEWVAVIAVVVVVAVIASLITANITGNVIKVNKLSDKSRFGTEVYTKAEVDDLFGNLKVLVEADSAKFRDLQSDELSASQSIISGDYLQAQNIVFQDSLKILCLAGNGTAYVCVNPTGEIYRKVKPC